METCQPEKEQAEQETIVEIGPDLPIYEMFGEESIQRIKEGAPYIAINSDVEDLKKVKRDKLGQAVVGDIRDLPLKDEVADQIWLMNVFGGFENKPRRRPDGSIVWTMGLGDVFTELARVAKKGGKIYIGETYTPMRKVKGLTKEDYSQFGLKKEIYKGIEDVTRFMRQMGANEVLIDSLRDKKDEEPFFLVLEKDN